MTLSSSFALKRGGGHNNEGGVTTREYGILKARRVSQRNIETSLHLNADELACHCLDNVHKCYMIQGDFQSLSIYSDYTL